jgi:hypothetical protein
LTLNSNALIEGMTDNTEYSVLRESKIKLIDLFVSRACMEYLFQDFFVTKRHDINKLKERLKTIDVLFDNNLLKDTSFMEDFIDKVGDLVDTMETNKAASYHQAQEVKEKLSSTNINKMLLEYKLKNPNANIPKSTYEVQNVLAVSLYKTRMINRHKNRKGFKALLKTLFEDFFFDKVSQTEAEDSVAKGMLISTMLEFFLWLVLKRAVEGHLKEIQDRLIECSEKWVEEETPAIEIVQELVNQVFTDIQVDVPSCIADTIADFCAQHRIVLETDDSQPVKQLEELVTILTDVSLPFGDEFVELIEAGVNALSGTSNGLSEAFLKDQNKIESNEILTTEQVYGLVQNVLDLMSTLVVPDNIPLHAIPTYQTCVTTFERTSDQAYRQIEAIYELLSYMRSQGFSLENPSVFLSKVPINNYVVDCGNIFGNNKVRLLYNNLVTYLLLSQ